MRGALDKTKGTTRVGIINSLGARRDAGSVQALGQLVNHSDPVVAEAAIQALGKIGGPQAAALLADAKRKVAHDLVPAVNEALLVCASGLADSGHTDKAQDIFRQLYVYRELPQTRAAALQGLVRLRPDAVVPLIMPALQREDRIVRSAAAEALREIKAPDVTEGLCKALPGMQPAVQVVVLHAMADRGDIQALPAVIAAAGHADPAVRTAALAVLGTLGDRSCVLLLATTAATGPGEEAAVARASLDRLKGKDIDATIAQALGKGDPRVRVELIRSLGARHARNALPSLWTTAVDRDESVRSESFKTLGGLASEKELPKLLDLLLKEKTDGPRDQAEAAVLAVATRIRDPKSRLEPILVAFPSTDRNVPARCALVRVLGKLQGDEAFGLIRTCLTSADPKVKETAVRALGEWKTPAPIPDLYEVARKGTADPIGLAALQGYLRLLTVPSNRRTDESVDLYEKGLALATRVEEKKRVVAGLAELGGRRGVDLLKRLEQDKDLKAEVSAALEKILNRSRQATASHGAGEAKNALDGNADTRWTTGCKMDKGMWFQLDLGVESEVLKLVLDTSGSPGDYPRGYEVYVSDQTNNWGDPVAKGEGKGPVTDITCKPKTGRYVRIVQTGTSDGAFWSIHEMRIETK